MSGSRVLTGVGATRLREGPWRVVVVGAGGWLGLATLELLHHLFGEHFPGRVRCFGSNARNLVLRGGVTVDQLPLSSLADLPTSPTLVLHMAFLTQEKAKAMPEADYVAANRAITEAVLAALDGLGVEGVFLPSSGAVYMVDQADAQASMRLYGRLKLEDEGAVAAWARARRRRAVIARVFNLSGPHINKQSSYALACFIADALAGQPIEIRATKPVLRSYVAISELMSIVFGALTEPGAGSLLFDTRGDEVLEMSQIAEAVRDVLGRRVALRRPALIDVAPDRYVGDGAAYRRLREAFAVQPVDFCRQVDETARFMAGQASNDQGHAAPATARPNGD